mmetsp:Transcript_31100/g.34414  ORF Transcript_31100/g.34414 Transcript_31100/m.34414 type:complete len:337 (-) Transcript_31100:60-1070(-)
MLGDTTTTENNNNNNENNNSNNENSATTNIYLSMALTFVKTIVTKFQQFLRTLPLVTSFLVGIITIGYLFEFFAFWRGDDFVSFHASSIITEGQWYRLFTYEYFHRTIYQYLIVLVLILYLLGYRLERSLGSLVLTTLLLLGLLFQPPLQLLLSWLPYKILNMKVFYAAHCRGMTGILFQFLTLEYGASTKQIPVPFNDNTNIPLNCLPFLLLFVAEIVFWNTSSFMSHLAGIVLGYAMVYTKKYWLCPLGKFYHTYLERDSDADGFFFRCCTGRSNFVPTPDDIVLNNSNNDDEALISTAIDGDDDNNNIIGNNSSNMYSSPDYRPLDTEESIII